jgi:hypothetical protein
VVAHSVRQVADQRQVQLSQLVVFLAHEGQIEEAIRWSCSVGLHPRVRGIIERHFARVLGISVVALCRFDATGGGAAKLDGVSMGVVANRSCESSLRSVRASRSFESVIGIGQHLALQIRAPAMTLTDETLK